MLPVQKTKLAVGLLSASLVSVNAFWRMNCDVVQTGRIDPIVNPGALSAHCHTIVGGSNIGVNSTFDSMINSECNSCEIYPDKSSYWTPNLYYSHTNGTFEEVPHSGSVIYYLARGVTQDGRQDFVPYPKGFKMLSGNKAVRSYNATGVTWGNATYPSNPKSDAITFACLSDPLGPETPNMVNVSTCINGLRAQIHFQTCWNGVDLYKSDNSHVAYLSAIDNGVCPPGYPVLLPHLFMETNYGVTDISDPDAGGFYTFSQGDPTGYGFHGDFLMGWETDIFEYAVANCISDAGFGTIEECPILQANRAIEFGKNCPPQPPQVDEPVHGLLDNLPGCIEITPGPEAATAAQMECGAGVESPTISTTIDSTPLPTMNPDIGEVFGLSYHQYIGCGNDSVGSPLRTLNAAYIEDDNMSVEFCQSYCTNLGYRYSGVEYQIQCYCDLALNPTAEFYAGVNMSMGCDMTCPGNRSELCGGDAYITVFNNTDPSFVPTNDTSGSAVQLTTPLGAYSSNYVGCANELTNGRALNASALTQANMTLEICESFCASMDYPYYGLEYFSQCYCGDGLADGSMIVDTDNQPAMSNCNDRCAGNFSQICGGSNYLSVYQNPDYIPVQIVQSVGSYVTQGCLTDPDPAQRTLSGAFYQDMANMTVESCVTYCSNLGFHYAGIEYSFQCLCGNSIQSVPGGMVETCPPGAFLKVCAGNEYEYCGAGSLMNLYYSATLSLTA